MKTTKEKLQELKDIAEKRERIQKKYKDQHERFINDVQPELDEAIKGMNEFDELLCYPFALMALNGHLCYISGKEIELESEEAMYKGIVLRNILTT